MATIGAMIIAKLLAVSPLSLDRDWMSAMAGR
jgi:hypothetical protein